MAETALTDKKKRFCREYVIDYNQTKAAIRAALTNAIVKLRENNFDDSGVIEFGPADYALFKDELIDKHTLSEAESMDFLEKLALSIPQDE